MESELRFKGVVHSFQSTAEKKFDRQLDFEIADTKVRIVESPITENCCLLNIPV